MGHFFRPRWIAPPSVQSPVLALSKGQTVYNESLSEAASAGDAQSAAAVFPCARAEAATASEAQSSSAAFVGALTEAGSAADSESSSAVLVGALTEAGSAAERCGSAYCETPTTSQLPPPAATAVAEADGCTAT